jgi:hypothetical protein
MVKLYHDVRRQMQMIYPINGLYIGFSGSKRWYQNGQRNRLNGPASSYVNNDKFWYQNDQRHRLDGPAIEYNFGDKKWYYQGEYIDCSTQEEFERIIKLKILW